MAQLTFDNAALNNDYEINAALDADQKIITPDGYEGMLTKVKNAATLDSMITRGSNLVAALP